jgi:hypothetical protein
VVAEMPRRTALLARLVATLRGHHGQ